MTTDEPLLAHLERLPPIRVVYTDLDGTLLGAGGALLADADGAPSASAAMALVEAREAGITVVPVTGRNHRGLAGDCRLLGLADWIAEAGTVVMRGGELTYRWGEAPTDEGATPRETLRRCGALDALLERFAGRLEVFTRFDEGRVGEFLLRGRIDTDEANTLLTELGAGWAHVVDNGSTHGGRGTHAYHLLPRGTGKALAVRDDLAARELQPSQSMAVGDSIEDATMSTEVGTYVQVANGHADLVAPNCFTVEGAMSVGFAAAVQAALAARRDEDAPWR